MGKRMSHDDRSELHGITVIVDTKGPRIFVGRCHEEDDEQIVLLDADDHEDGHEGRSKEDYIQQAARYGVWKKHARIAIPRADVVSITRLGEVSRQ